MESKQFRPSFEQVEQTHQDLEKVLRDRLHRSNQVVVFPNLEDKRLNYDGIRFSQKKKDILVLILIYHFSDYLDYFSEYVRYEVEMYLFKRLLFPELFASFVDKRICLEILLTLNYTPRELFSLVSKKNLDRILKSLSLKIVKPSIVKKPVYRRGYNDKGSLRAESKRPVDEPDGVAQLTLEEQRNLYYLSVDLIVREVGGWVLQEHSNNEKINLKEESK